MDRVEGDVDRVAADMGMSWVERNLAASVGWGAGRIVHSFAFDGGRVTIVAETPDGAFTQELPLDGVPHDTVMLSNGSPVKAAAQVDGGSLVVTSTGISCRRRIADGRLLMEVVTDSGAAATHVFSRILGPAEARDPERGLEADKVALLGSAETPAEGWAPEGGWPWDPKNEGWHQRNPLDIPSELFGALGGIVFPRVQADGSMENSYTPPEWSKRAPRRKKERTGFRYCCWRRPLRDGEVSVWVTRFRADMVANTIYLGIALCLWMIAEQGGVWKWWTLLVGVMLGAVVVFKNVFGFYQEIAPLVDDDNLLELISENVDGVKKRIHEVVHYKLGHALLVRDELYMDGWKANEKHVRELHQEEELEEFVSGVLLQAVDKAAADITSRPPLSRLAPWICQASPRFLSVCATVLVLLVLVKSVVDFVNWPMAVDTKESNPFEGMSEGSYPCLGNVCTEDGKQGFCHGDVYYAKKFADANGEAVGGEAYAKLSSITAGRQGPFARLDTEGDYLCHAVAHFPPVDYTMHCICDHQPASRRLADAGFSDVAEFGFGASGSSDVAAFGFQVILGNIAINAVVAALASWPLIRWFSNFTLAHMEYEFWRQMDRGVRQSIDVDLFQTMLDKEFKDEMDIVVPPPLGADDPYHVHDDGCCTM
jgi:hypothetical protein